jgi:hypothetical protein
VESAGRLLGPFERERTLEEPEEQSNGHSQIESLDLSLFLIG